MRQPLIDRLVAAAVFVYALVLYGSTVAPTASFWDSGEFIAIAHGLQVSHPPGAPFYMLVGRLFSIVLAPVLGVFTETGAIALAVNFVSVLASALTILLTHLIIVRLVRQWQGPPEAWTGAERIAALAGGVVGACAFAATDSFWFNAVEAEVYALSMFFTAAVVWLIMQWSAQANAEEARLAGGQHPFGLSANRYLILIAYLFGLAIGVHLLNLLALFFIALIVFFTEFEQPTWTRGRLWGGIVVAGLVSAAAFLAVYPGLVQALPGAVGASGAPVLVTILFLAVVAGAVYYTQKKGMQAANLVALCVTVILIGYSTYALIFIRSAANPPIDENDPETVEAIVSYLKREQYGQTPLLKGATFNDRTGTVGTDETLFPRRYSPAPEHLRVYAQYDSDWEFFWEYQVGHMYVRYFLWNFAGRASDLQDAPAITGFETRPVSDVYVQSPSEAASRNAYYALPLLLGLLGAAYHFMRDWRRAFAVLILFLVTGIGIILYLNQPPLQPRERDYSYVASFFAFSLWIGIGATGLITLTAEALRERLGEAGSRGILLGLGGLLFLAVPALMAVENYDDHDRSGRYVAPEYAYNMLMSVEEDAILFTNGDNDTFPLWYLQEVEGVRQDVRVVNLSLLNTPWYVRQLKNQASRASEPLPISLSDEQIERLQPIAWEPQEVSVPVDPQAYLQSTELPTDPALREAIESPMAWTLTGRPYSQDFNILYAADQVAFDIIATNARQGWERPVYFAVTVSQDGQLDLAQHFQLEGQAFRVVPIETDRPLGRIAPEVTIPNLENFRFTGLDNPDAYFDENIRRMVDNYRNIYATAAEQLVEQGRPDEAVALLDSFLTRVPYDVIPGDERSLVFVARAYAAAGAQDRVKELMQRAEPVVLHRLQNAQSARDANYAAQYAQLIQQSYLQVGDFEAVADFRNRLADALGDSSLRTTPQALRQELSAPAAPTALPGQE